MAKNNNNNKKKTYKGSLSRSYIFNTNIDTTKQSREEPQVIKSQVTVGSGQRLAERRTVSKLYFIGQKQLFSHKCTNTNNWVTEQGLPWAEYNDSNGPRCLQTHVEGTEKSWTDVVEKLVAASRNLMLACFKSYTQRLIKKKIAAL